MLSFYEVAEKIRPGWVNHLVLLLCC